MQFMGSKRQIGSLRRHKKWRYSSRSTKTQKADASPQWKHKVSIDKTS